ncbi:MAG: GTP-binding protein [Planctomycetota bacterium]
MTTKQDINLAICGHAWHGKSTLVGKTVAELGMVGRRKLKQFEEMARRGRDVSLVFALMVFRQKDVSHDQDEAARGITVLPSFVRFEFDKHRITVIDTPGQETYTNNRFSGMFSADCAALVVDVVGGVEPVTEQVMRVLKGYEIPLVGVLVTKIDRVDYRQEPYEETCDLVRMALCDYGIDDQVPFIPTSAYASGRPLTEPGEGITEFSERMAWYKGPTFHQLMDSIDMKAIRPEEPLRVLIHSADIHEQVPGIGTAFTGLVESGVLKRDQALVFEPASSEQGEQISAQVRSIELTKGHIATPGIPLTEGTPRQLVGVALRQADKLGLRNLFKGRGTVAGTVKNPPRVARKFLARITVFDDNVTMKSGQQLMMHTHVDKVAVLVRSIRLLPGQEGDASAAPRSQGRSKRLKNSVDPDEPKAEKGQIEHLTAGVWAEIEFEALRPVAIEEADVLAPLSKMVLRLDNRPIGLGKCVKITE